MELSSDRSEYSTKQEMCGIVATLSGTVPTTTTTINRTRTTTETTTTSWSYGGVLGQRYVSAYVPKKKNVWETEPIR
jgi:hypothetical protein